MVTQPEYVYIVHKFLLANRNHKVRFCVVIVHNKLEKEQVADSFCRACDVLHVRTLARPVVACLYIWTYRQ